MPAQPVQLPEPWGPDRAPGHVLRGAARPSRASLLFSVGWFDWQGTDTIVEETGLVAIDTETDTVARFDVDDRCAGITEAIEVGSGDVYLITRALARSGARRCARALPRRR